MALQIRRGTNAERLTITPLQGELIFTTDTKNVYVGDGITLGGVAISTVTDSETIQDVVGPMFTGGTHSGISFSYNDTSGTVNATVTGGGGSGTVTSVSVASANGFAGSVANATTTPAITLSTSITGVLKGNGTAISAAVAGTDYQAPISLTTTGSSGAATLIGNTLNIPQYTGGGAGTTYAISAETATGGVNLRLTGSDSSTDNVKLAEGSNITITRTDADTITIAAASGVSTINDLTDVTISGTPSNNSILKYNNLTNQWVNGSTEINEDITPTLGGSLDLNGFNITGTGSININGTITADAITANNNVITDFISVNNNLAVLGVTSLNQTIILNDNNTVATLSCESVTTNPSITLRRARGTFGSYTPVLAGDIITTIDFQGRNGTSFLSTATIQVRVPSTTPTSVGVLPSEMRFLVTDATGVNLNPVTIQASGSTLFTSYRRDLPNIILSSAHSEATGSNLLLMRRSRGTIEIPTTLNNGDSIYGLSFQGYTGTNFITAANIRGRVDGAVGASAVPGKIEFITADASGTLAIRMSLDKDGQLSVDTIKGNTTNYVTFAQIPVLPTYADETAANAAVTIPVNGMMYYDSGAAKIKGYQGGAWVILQP